MPPQNLDAILCVVCCAALLFVVVVLTGRIRRLQSAVSLLEMQSEAHGHTIYAVHGYRVERLGRRFDALRDELLERSGEDRQALGHLEKGLGLVAAASDDQCTALFRRLYEVGALVQGHSVRLDKQSDAIDNLEKWFGVLRDVRKEQFTAVHEYVSRLDARCDVFNGVLLNHEQAHRDHRASVHKLNARCDAIVPDLVARICRLSDRVESAGKVLYEHIDSRPAADPCCLGLGPVPAMLDEIREGIAAYKTKYVDSEKGDARCS